MTQALAHATALHVVPALPYALNALSPTLSARTLELHHGKHHRGYVDALNALVAGTDYADMTLEQTIAASAADTGATAVFNQAAQAWNHAFYWRSLRPDGGGEPPRSIKLLIEDSFGCVRACKDALAAAAAERFGSGWVWLVLDDRTLKVVDTANAEAPLAPSQTRLLVIDVWEHAYYLDYQNRRTEHVSAVLDKLINWGFAADNLT